MRPLMEIMEDERMTMLRLESIDRQILRDSDPEVQDILFAQRTKFTRKLENIRSEMKQYIDELSM